MIVKMRPVLVSVFVAIVMATVYQQGVQAKPSQAAFLQRILQDLTEEEEGKDVDLIPKEREVGAKPNGPPDLDFLQHILQEALKEHEKNGGEGE